MLNERFSLRDRGLSTSVDGAIRARHRWYHVKESFSPALLEAAIDDAGCKRGDVIVDPFCGSGTAPLVAVQQGLSATGFEVNPFLAFVSRAKLAKVSSSALEQSLDMALEGADRGERSALSGFSTFAYRPGAEKWLFNRPVLRAFQGAWDATEAVRGAARSVVRLALLGAAMDSCNAVRDGKCLRYRREWRQIGFGKSSFAEALEARTRAIAEDLGAIKYTGKGEVVLGDSRTMLSGLREKFQLCVTSPPYLNSFDYSDIYRPEMFLGGFVQSMADLREVRLKTIRSHVQVDWQRPTRPLASALAARCMRGLRDRKSELWDSRIPAMVHAYFEDMAGVLAKLRSAADKNAVLWMVVSTSAYAGVEIPVDLILAELGVAGGWCLREVGVLRYLRSSGQHWSKMGTLSPPLRESVVILDASARSVASRRRN